MLCLPSLSAAEYTVQPGDTLHAIAKRYLPPGKQHDALQINQFIERLMQLNRPLFPQMNADQLSTGMKLELPQDARVGGAPVELVQQPVALGDLSSHANIARVTDLTGSGWLLRSDETRESLYVGQFINQGDSILTEHESFARITFIDQTRLMVKQSTRINVATFNWDEQTGTGRLIIDFIKGVFRSVSGLIAKHSPANYSVKTPVATIGMRGTDFGARFCEFNTCEINSGNDSLTLSKGLYIGVLKGQISSQSHRGETLVSAGEAIYQQNAASEVKKIRNLPGVIFSAAELDTYHKPPVIEQTRATAKKAPLYRAFWRNSAGEFIKDAWGNCIRSNEYRVDHNVAECH